MVNPGTDIFLICKNELMRLSWVIPDPSIDQYALNGHHVRGFRLFLCTQPLSIYVINGQTKRAVQGKPAENAIVIAILIQQQIIG
jgi:hypothetical protein